MPSANLTAYLAKNYLTASNLPSDSLSSSDFQDSSRPKKKRRKNKDTSEGGGLIVADDDEGLSLRDIASQRRGNADGDDADDVPTFESGVKSAEFRKKKGGGGWKVVSAAQTTEASDNANQGDKEDADRILAEAAEESRLRRQELEDEDAPAVVDLPDVGSNGSGLRMQSGARAGLQTAADTAALMAREQRERELEAESARKKSKSKKSKETVPEEETIYRDATGRRIDVSLKRAEARAAAEEKVRAERKERENAMGDVQRREKEARKQELEDAKFLSLARGADDEEMNDELKGRMRWDDPMAKYMAERRAEEEAETRALSKSTVKGRSGATTTTSNTSVVRKKMYQGPPAAPNRYGILPGWRWDGVDRSNGFEKEWFQARSRRGREEELKFQWQMDE